MKPNCLSILLICALSSSAIHVPFGISKRSLQNRSFGTARINPVVNAVVGDGVFDAGLSTVNDLLYMANISLGGTDYIVQLDTGSSDFWIRGDSFPLPNVASTPYTFNLTYGIGWAYGNISTAEVVFAGITIPQQAFLDVVDARNPALQYGAQGVLGLGFTSLSNIDHTVNGTGGDWGRSTLYNAFLDHPEELNYITFALQRSLDPNDDTEGVFTIGEVDDKYSDINNVDPISTWPVESPSRWNVLLDALFVDTETTYGSTNVSGAPADRAVVLLDSGTSYSYVPNDIAEAIYGNVPGAFLNAQEGIWSVPCDAEVDMALQFNGEVYPLHPLDIVVSSSATGSLQSCIGSFIPQAVAVGGGQFDWLLGANFLRSAYTMYDFGDFDSNGRMGDPYVKLLSLTDPNEASAEFVAIRGGTARTDISYQPVNVGSSSGSANVSVTGSVADKLSKLTDYIPAVLAILVLNAVALLVIGIVGIVYMCKRRRRRNAKKDRVMRLDARGPTPYPGGIGMSPSPQPGSGSASHHDYEQVSTHVPLGEQEPEDAPFTPPEPAFHSYDGDTLRPLQPGARPRSTIGGIGIPRDYRVSAAGSDVTAFVPPSPAYKMADRPKSIA